MDGSDALQDAVESFARAKGLFSPAAMGYFQGALQARQQLASASAILEQAAAIARDACALARPSFERSGLMAQADALVSAERDLVMFGQVCARSLMVADRSLENGFLRQVATAASLGMEFADSSPLLLGFAWCAAANHLHGHALWRYRAACERAQSALRNAASGAALGATATEIGNDAYPMLASAHPELDQIYGAATAAKATRDMSMVLGTAAHEWLAEGRQAPLTQWLSWLAKAIGPHVVRYSGDIWGSVFASMAAAAMARIPSQQLPGCVAPLLEVSLHGHALRRAVHGLLRAEDAGHLSARRHSESLAAAPRHQQRVAQLFSALACASVVADEAHAERSIAAMLNDVRAASTSENCLLGLSAAGSEALGVAYTPFVARAVDAGIESARAFAALQQLWRRVPEMAAQATSRLPANDAAWVPWLTGVLALLIDLAIAQSTDRAEQTLSQVLLADFAGQSGGTSALEAQALSALAEHALRQPEFAAVPRLDSLLKALGAMAQRWQAVLAMRATTTRSDASDTWAHGLSARLAQVLLNGAAPLAIQDAVHWLATAWVPHVRFAVPEQSPETLAAPALAELQAQLPTELRSHVGALADGIGDATAASIVLAHADRWCAQTIAELTARPHCAALRGMEPRCIRDLSVLVKAVGSFLGSGYGDVQMRVRAFAAAHLLPFLREETRSFAGEMLALLEAHMSSLSGSAKTRVAALLASAYQLDGVSR